MAPGAIRRAPLLLALAAVVALGACGGGKDGGPAEVVTAGGAQSEPTPLLRSLERLPAVEALRRQVLFGDLARLRAAYAEPEQLTAALPGLWLPDALAAADKAAWRRRFGFGLAAVERFVAAGFHPEEAAVLTGRFKPGRVREALRQTGYRRQGRLLARGADGEVDASSPAGRLALSALNRVSVTRGRLVAASSARLARATLDPKMSLGEDADLSAAALALGEVTAAVILPADLVRPAAGVLIATLAEEPALLLGVGVDDRGPAERIFRATLVYRSPSEAQREAAAIGSAFASAEVPTRPGVTFGDLFEGLEARVAAGRAVVLEGRIADGELTGVWRGLLESGDLAVLVRRQ